MIVLAMMFIKLWLHATRCIPECMHVLAASKHGQRGKCTAQDIRHAHPSKSRAAQTH